jgi:gentisate 1,2-dioxygenase
MTWHDHSNETSEPMFWLDGLDIPMVQFFDASFAEGSNEDQQKISKPAGDSFARYGHNLLPVDWKPEVKTSPVFNYPYSRTREALDALSRNGAPDPYHGHKLRYVNPATGGSPMPTMATFMQRLPAGFAGKPWRQTDGAVFSVVEGSGTVHIERNGETQVFEFGPRDHFVIPSWHTAQLRSAQGCVLFSFSDRPVHQALGIHREERLS